jgi:hypothetical protein
VDRQPRLNTSGKIENGVLSIGLTAVPNNWLTSLTSREYSSLIPANQKPSVTPNTKVGHLSLKFEQDGYKYEIIIKDTETSNTSYYYNYVNKKALITGKDNLQMEIEGTEFFYSYDIDMSFLQGWNISADTTEVTMMDPGSMTMTEFSRTPAELPETARWYYW